jgi:nucleotide-binding universal stress UspA family protein
MYPFRRILVPTDFSTASEWAFDEAVRLAAETGAELLVLHVRRTWKDQPERLRFQADESLYEYAERQELDRLRDRIRRAHASLEVRMIVKQAPIPAKSISATAAAEQADLIVIATHGRHHVAHILIGSTTTDVVNDPPSPLLAIRYGIRKRERYARIVVPVHPNQTSQAALELTEAMARRTGAEVHLLTVCNDADRKAALEHMQTLTARLEGLTSRQEILSGDDVEKELIRYTTRVNGDVIILNAAGGLSELKASIVRHATVPVMIVP